MGRWWEETRRDLIQAARALAHSPGFTAAAVLTLAIGIGAASAIFSVAEAVLLSPLRFPDADRLVTIVEHDRPASLPRLTFQEYVDWRSRTRTLSGLAASSLEPQLNVRTPSGTVRMTAAFVSGNYFDVLGVSAALGRALTPADEAESDVAVLSHESWSRLFQSNPAAIGQVLEGRSGMAPPRLFTIVGVMPADLEQTGTPFDLYAPIRVTSSARASVGSIIGRLAPGATLADATAEANQIGAAIRPPRPAAAPPLTRERFGVGALKDDVVSSLGGALRIFLIAVAVVMMIACANVANLVLARGTGRQRDIAVRLAIGASRSRIVRHLAAEGALMALAGGALGALLAAGGVTLVRQLAAVEAPGVFRLIFGTSVLPRAASVGVDPMVLVTAFALAVFTSLACGLLPALRLSRVEHLHLATIGVRGIRGSKSDSRLRAVLVVAQVSLASMLLVGGGLLARSFVNLQDVRRGYDPEGVVAFQLVLPEDYATSQKEATVGEILSRVRALPEVSRAGFSYAGVLVGVEDTVGAFVPPGRPREEVAADRDRPRLRSISPGYLEAVGARLAGGRWLDDNDATLAAPAVVVNQAVARRYFGEGQAVGGHLDWYDGSAVPTRVTIVGVVEDIREGSLEREPFAEVFLDYRQVARILESRGQSKRQADQITFGFMSFAARTSGDPRGLITRIRTAVAAADRAAGLDAIAPLEQLVGHALARRRFHAVMLGACAAVAALLALIGIYGVLAYAVAQRTQEMGVRLALGARRSQVLALVLGRGLVLSGAGVFVGLVGAAIGTRLLQGLLFGITALDAATFAGVAITFLAVAGLASFVPARRAMRVDPVVALRHE
jgi:putative ABC transport system permease protein